MHVSVRVHVCVRVRVCVCVCVCVCGLHIMYIALYELYIGSSYTRFLQHRRVPLVSTSEVNLVRESSVDFDYSRIALIKLHGKCCYSCYFFDGLMVNFVGAFMILAWTFSANIGKFTAAHMKPALPNGGWFQMHRIFMILALFFCCLAFILIFVAFRNAPTRGLITLGDLVSVLL